LCDCIAMVCMTVHSICTDRKSSHLSLDLIEDAYIEQSVGL